MKALRESDEAQPHGLRSRAIDLLPWQRWTLRGFVVVASCTAAGLFTLAWFLVWLLYVFARALR